MDFRSAIICVIFLMSSCNETKHEQSNQLTGKWSFVNDNIYGELYVDSNDLKFKLEDGTYGPYKYEFTDDTLKYFNKYYRVIFDSYNSIKLENNQGVIKMKRMTSYVFGQNQIDPFYLRRCNYLVNNNFIDIDSALSYLCAIEMTDIETDTVLNIND